MPQSTEDNFYQLFDSEYSRPLDLKLKSDLESHGFSLELLKADRSKSLPPEPQTHRLWRNFQLLRTKRVIITVLLLIIGVIVGSVLAVVFGNRESGTVDSAPEPSASTALALSAVSMSANFQTNTSLSFMVAGSGPKALAQTASSTVPTTIVPTSTDSQTDPATQTEVLATTTPPPTPTREARPTGPGGGSDVFTVVTTGIKVNTRLGEAGVGVGDTEKRTDNAATLFPREMAVVST